MNVNLEEKLIPKNQTYVIATLKKENLKLSEMITKKETYIINISNQFSY